MKNTKTDVMSIVLYTIILIAILSVIRLGVIIYSKEYEVTKEEIEEVDEFNFNEQINSIRENSLENI